MPVNLHKLRSRPDLHLATAHFCYNKLMGGSLAIAFGAVFIMIFGIFLNNMNRLALRKINPPVFVIYFGNALAYGLAAPAIIYCVAFIVPLIASSSLNLQVTYSSFAAAGVEGFVLLLPPIIGGALGTVLTSSDYDRRLRGIRHLLMLAAALGLYRVIINFVIFKTFP